MSFKMLCAILAVAFLIGCAPKNQGALQGKANLSELADTQPTPNVAPAVDNASNNSGANNTEFIEGSGKSGVDLLDTGDRMKIQNGKATVKLLRLQAGQFVLYNHSFRNATHEWWYYNRFDVVTEDYHGKTCMGYIRSGSNDEGNALNLSKVLYCNATIEVTFDHNGSWIATKAEPIKNIAAKLEPVLTTPFGESFVWTEVPAGTYSTILAKVEEQSKRRRREWLSADVPITGLAKMVDEGTELSTRMLLIDANPKPGTPQDFRVR